MANLSPLSLALKKHYEGANRMTGAPSDSLTSKIELKCLELNDLDLNSGDISPLSSFLSSKEAVHGIETLILKSRSSSDRHSVYSHDGGKNSGSGREREQRSTSAFTGKLINAIILFISKSSNLHTVIMDSMRLQRDVLASFGEALSSTKSVVRWLSFKSCPFGNTGVKVLRPHLSKMQLQVLVFERCSLSDESCTYLSSILKSQEAMLDTLFWNTTLRSDPLSISSAAAAKHTKETNRVLSSGLVAISINGNHVTKKGIDVIRRAICNNHWILGLNLANNRIEEEGINLLVSSLQDNNALHALLLGGNPGFCTEAACFAAETTSKAPLRLSMMPQGVTILLKRWMTLQLKERMGDEAEALSASVIDESARWVRGSRESRESRDSVLNDREDLTAVSPDRAGRRGGGGGGGGDRHGTPDRSERSGTRQDVPIGYNVFSNQDISGARPHRKHNYEHDALMANQFERFSKTSHTIPGVTGEWDRPHALRTSGDRPYTSGGGRSWSSSSATEGWSRQLKHLVDTSIGRYERFEGNDSLQGPHRRLASTTAKRQESSCTRLSQGIASIDRVVPIIKAKWSPQRRTLQNNYTLDSSRNGGSGRERDVSEISRSNRYNSSPSLRQMMSDREIDDQFEDRQFAATLDNISNSGYSSNSYNGRQSSRGSGGGGRARARSSAREESLKGVISLLSESVSEIRESLGRVTEQLRDVTGSLSASVLERSQYSHSVSQTGQNSQNGTPNKSPSSSYTRGSDIPSGVTSLPQTSSPAVDHMTQTFGRTRGSLVRHSGPWDGSRDIFDRPERRCQDNGTGGTEFEGDGGDHLSSAMWRPQDDKDPHADISRDSHSSHNHIEDRTDQTRRSESPPAPPVPAKAVPYVPHAYAASSDPPHDSEMSGPDMATLIRDRLRKKLKAVLRPES